MKELIKVLKRILIRKNLTWDEMEVLMKYSHIYDEDYVNWDFDAWYDLGERDVIRHYELEGSSLKFGIIITEYYPKEDDRGYGDKGQWKFQTYFDGWEYDKDKLKHYIEHLKKGVA